MRHQSVSQSACHHPLHSTAWQAARAISFSSSIMCGSAAPGATAHQCCLYRNVKQYPEAEQLDGLLLLRIDAPLYFANINPMRDAIARRAFAAASACMPSWSCQCQPPQGQVEPAQAGSSRGRGMGPSPQACCAVFWCCRLPHLLCQTRCCMFRAVAVSSLPTQKMGAPPAGPSS